MTATTPRWQDLLQRLIHADHPDEPMSEVEPYQAQPALGLDLATAWNDALLPATLLDSDAHVSARFPTGWQAARYLCFAAPFPCCTGLAPQFLQNISGIMNDASNYFQQQLPGFSSVSGAEMTLETKSVLSQLALARVGGDATRTSELIDQLDNEHLRQNERAAQLWLSGDRTQAESLWHDIDLNHPVIAFNRGLAALANGQHQRGQGCMTRAARGFPESTGWHHLAELYLAVSERR
jgi:hypothetical protein